ncbi:hypothetical protein AVEN_239717-1 [Araneus ventricosus]|uniref:PiggyBac transposable element-derived protein domain-containing protein n=1 Tax=Araneus ventricosus TaxID=182803 RepID=A0A4Y2Q3I5_ARAVE|nr:hypothetical protein AVEN_239717-1 [Araneus ventricosus]
MSGSNYHISIRQLFEAEKKIRICSLLKRGISSKTFGQVLITNTDLQDFGDVDEGSVVLSVWPSIHVDGKDIEGVRVVLGPLTYIAGYCVFIVVKKLKCDACKSNLTVDKTIEIDENYGLIFKLDRLQLLFPTPNAVNAIVHNYIIIKKLCSDFEDDFIASENPRKIALKLSENYLNSGNLFEHDCDNKYSHEKIQKIGGWITDRMRDSLQVMIDGFEKAMKEGKTISEKAFKKAEELYQKLLDWGIDVGEEIKDALDRSRGEIEKNTPDRADNPMQVMPGKFLTAQEALNFLWTLDDSDLDDIDHELDFVAGKSIIELFELICLKLIELTFEELIKYSRQKNNNVFEISMDEMKQFLGILFYSGYHILPQEKMYWENANDI